MYCIEIRHDLVVAPIVSWSWFCNKVLFCNHLAEEEEAGCFTLIACVFAIGLAPITLVTHVCNNDSNIQGRSLNVI